MTANDWIVLPRLVAREAWAAHLMQAASASGRALHDWDLSQDLGQASHSILLTASADVARAHQPDASRIAAVIDRLDVALPPDAIPAQRHHVVHEATESFAQLAALPRERVFGPAQFARGPVEVLPSLRVSALPMVATSAESPLATALKLYTEDQARWPGTIFSWNSPPTTDARHTTIDLTGRPKILAYGPYIVMPKGRWKAVFTLSFDDYGSRYMFRADWGGVTDYASQEFRPGRPGVFELEMFYDWAENSACEFRILVLEGVFHGRMTLSDLTVSRAE